MLYPCATPAAPNKGAVIAHGGRNFKGGGRRPGTCTNTRPLDRMPPLSRFACHSPRNNGGRNAVPPRKRGGNHLASATGVNAGGACLESPAGKTARIGPAHRCC